MLEQRRRLLVEQGDVFVDVLQGGAAGDPLDIRLDVLAGSGGKLAAKGLRLRLQLSLIHI